MTRQARVLWTCIAAAIIVTGLAVHAQAPQRSGSSAAAAAVKTAPPYVPSKTPWGDPDLQGTYTNKDENGIPMERPGQFAGKSADDVDDSEFAEIVRERQQRALASAAGIGGADTGAGLVTLPLALERRSPSLTRKPSNCVRTPSSVAVTTSR